MLNNKALAKLIKAATKGSLYHKTTANGTTLTTWTGNAAIIAEADIVPVKGTKYITSAAIDYAATTGDFRTGEDVEADDVIGVPEDKYNFVCEVEYRTLKEATTFAAGKHALNKLLTTVHFNANANVIEALDGNRIYTRRVQEIAAEATIPADVFRFNGINEKVKIYAGEHNYMLCGDGFTIIGNLYEGQYFKVYEMMKYQEDGNTRVTVDVDDFIDVMKTLKAAKSKNPVVFNVTREGIEYYLDVDGIETRGSIDAKVEGTPMLIGLNPKYLFDAVNVINTKRAYITLNNQKAPIFIEDEGFIYNNVILPVNIDIDFYKSIFSKEAAKETEEGQATETETEAETVAEKKEEAATEATEATEATTEEKPETAATAPAKSETSQATQASKERTENIMNENKKESKPETINTAASKATAPATAPARFLAPALSELPTPKQEKKQAPVNLGMLPGVHYKTTKSADHINIWIFGNTKQHKETLKAAGFRWAPNWKGASDRSGWYKREMIVQ